MYKPTDLLKHIKIEKKNLEPEFKDKGFRVSNEEVDR